MSIGSNLAQHFAMPDDGGKVDRCVEETPRKAGRSLTSDEMRALNRAIFVFLGLSETEVEKEQRLTLRA